MTVLSVDTDLAMTMRDGTSLRSTLIRPAGPGAAPAVMLRTPYDRTTAASTALQVDALGLAEAGYAVVIQDVRGRYTSDGEFEPFVSEQEDGVDSVHWIADQPWCDGAIGTVGTSYNAFAQLATAVAAPEPLRAWVPALGPFDVRTSWIRQNGCLDVGFHLAWGLGTIVPDDRRTADPRRARAAHARPIDTMRRGVMDQPEMREAPAGAFYFEWLEREDPYPMDHRVPAAPAVAGVTAPALVVAGWFDVFCEGSLALHRELTAVTSARHGLVVGPWDHDGLPLDRRSGDRDFGAAAAVSLGSLQRRWFDRHLRDDDVGHDLNGVFVMGEDEWTRDPIGPPGTDPIALEMTRVATAGADSGLRLDPDRPPAMRGGRSFPWRPDLLCGVLERGAPDRSTVAFGTPPFGDDLVINGRVTCRVAIEAEADTYDVWAVLSEVDRDGIARNIVDGIATLRSVPGGPDEHEIPIGHVAHRLAGGSRLRLEIVFGGTPRLPAQSGVRRTGDSAVVEAAVVRRSGA